MGLVVGVVLLKVLVRLNENCSTSTLIACVRMQISAFHFCPLSHPITAIYDLSYGETEMALGRVSTAPFEWSNPKQPFLYSIHEECVAMC